MYPGELEQRLSARWAKVPCSEQLNDCGALVLGSKKKTDLVERIKDLLSPSPKRNPLLEGGDGGIGFAKVAKRQRKVKPRTLVTWIFFD